MKSKPIEYHPAARLEIAEALEWYEWHEAGLGARFLSELGHSERFIARHASLGTPYRYGTRKRRMHIFPYNLIYTVEPEAIWVIAVAHHARKPGYWLKRLLD